MLRQTRGQTDALHNQLGARASNSPAQFYGNDLQVFQMTQRCKPIRHGKYIRVYKQIECNLTSPLSQKDVFHGIGMLRFLFAQEQFLDAIQRSFGLRRHP